MEVVGDEQAGPRDDKALWLVQDAAAAEDLRVPAGQRETLDAVVAGVGRCRRRRCSGR
jgi:hypothetical protein